MTHDRATVAAALRLREEEGLGSRRVARRLGVSIGAVRDWHAGNLPRHSRPGAEDGCSECGHGEHRFGALPRDYVYLLGLYLGDGCISPAPKGVHRLRITLDLRYPGIINECARAIEAVLPANRVHRLPTPKNYCEVSAYSRSWPCLFPQHGPGTKHTRRIWLARWQQELAERWPETLVRGMIHSDGCRFVNNRGRRDSWSAPRYAFTNMSTDLTSIFCTACDRLGLRWTGAFPADERRAVTIYVSRKADVAKLDRLVGPKR